MSKEKELNNILDECLEWLLVKGETIEQCLERHPEQADSLRPLLQTALETKQALALQPRAEFKARARYQFNAALQEVSQRGRLSLIWLPGWATAVALVLGLLLMGGGTIGAAGYSMPDSLLYPIKLATEQVQVALTLSDTAKAELEASFADRRVTEIVYLAEKGDAERIEAVTRGLDKNLDQLASLAPGVETAAAPGLMEAPLALTEGEVTAPPLTSAARAEDAEGETGTQGAQNERDRLKTTIANYAVNHPAVLSAVLEKVPESAKAALQQAIDVARAGYEKALEGWE